MKSIQEYMTGLVETAVFPGASWAIGGNGTVFEMGTIGILGVGLGPVCEDSLYDLASLTKLFTTLALMKQLEEGLLRLEDRVDFFLPSFKNSPLADVTLFRLLTHTAPFPGGTMLYRHAHSREDILEAIRRTGIRNDDRVVYTCEAFILLGEIASAIDGISLDALIRARVTAPLGMNATLYKPPASLLDRIAPTEDCLWRGRLIRGEVHDENAALMGGVSGNAGLFSTALDMARFAASVLASLEGGDGAFLKRPVAKLMTRNYTEGRGENRGLGWMIKGNSPDGGDLMSSRSFGHTGFTGTSLWIDPDNQLYAVLLSNRIHPRRDNAGIFRARHIFHNLAVAYYGNEMKIQRGL